MRTEARAALGQYGGEQGWARWEKKQSGREGGSRAGFKEKRAKILPDYRAVSNNATAGGYWASVRRAKHEDLRLSKAEEAEEVERRGGRGGRGCFFFFFYFSPTSLWRYRRVFLLYGGVNVLRGCLLVLGGVRGPCKAERAVSVRCWPKID
ncbi:hypothetical protein TEQG_02366 [Trichophyton equinum CBS 127.97]|uniref:Uncharacterized protein n=1 Tax=Trichophyton equinum (strain ATCC MYA-4606 / CBS 127.97) TaxID=559882 RepID=F2PN65_TRIEC|nr:hypothetical protein TEQG_02366 [Trichophyton equinum CBS 127.97]